MQPVLLKLLQHVKPFQLFVEKRQFFNQNKQRLNNIMYH